MARVARAKNLLSDLSVGLGVELWNEKFLRQTMGHYESL